MEQTRQGELNWATLYERLRQRPELDSYSEPQLKWMSMAVMNGLTMTRLDASGFTEAEINCFMHGMMDEVTEKIKQLFENQKG